MDPSLLNADFGSDSEDDNFNPAPAIDSDDEEGAQTDAGVDANKTKSTNDQVAEDNQEVDGDNEDQDDAADAVHDDDDEEEEDEEEDDEDDEDAVSVGQPYSVYEIKRCCSTNATHNHCHQYGELSLEAYHGGTSLPRT